MATISVQGKKIFKGELQVPGDKSISHRALMLSSLAKGTSTITGLLEGEDCLKTLKAFQQMGIETKKLGPGEYEVQGKGLRGLTKPEKPIDCGNSGTSIRLLSGILAGQDFESILTGDASLRLRPMGRIIMPLMEMGARITSHNEMGTAPLMIFPSRLAGISYKSPIASAQVKSCILLAGLYAEGMTMVIEPYLSRDHTERMLSSLGIPVEREGITCSITSGRELQTRNIHVPGDISSAAFFIVGALITPGSKLVIKDVGLNPTRTGCLDILQQMGADITIKKNAQAEGEPSGDIEVRYSQLQGVTIDGPIIPRLIDEIPILAMAGAFAQGTTILKDARELRVKESDRITSIVQGLISCGVSVEENDDGFAIHGDIKKMKPTIVDAYMDHRIAMSFAIAGAALEGTMEIEGTDTIDTSYPGFMEDFEKVTG